MMNMRYGMPSMVGRRYRCNKCRDLGLVETQDLNSTVKDHSGRMVPCECPLGQTLSGKPQKPEPVYGTGRITAVDLDTGKVSIKLENVEDVRKFLEAFRSGSSVTVTTKETK